MRLRQACFLASFVLSASSLSAPAFAQKAPKDKDAKDKDKDKDKDKEKDKLDGTPLKANDLALSVGENKTISAVDVKNYSEGTPGIVDIKLTTDATQFVVVGLKPGTTSLLLIKKSGQEINYIISVFSRSPALVESEVTELITNFPGVKIKRVGGRIFLDGTVGNEVDLKRVNQIAALYPGQVESLVTIGTRERSTNIRIDFFFVQYDKNSSYQIGVDYPTKIGGPFVTSNLGYDFVAKTTTAQANVVNQPLPGLDIASHYGWAKVIKQATVITANGTDALFENGGEQNFPVASGLTGTIQKISFGTQIVVQPLYDPTSKELELKISADVSDLVPGIKSTPLPGRQTAKLNTIVHMKVGQSLILSGIHASSESKTIDGLPLLSRIPILGPLFGSWGATETELESAIFIVPSVVQEPKGTAASMVSDALAEYEKFTGEVPSTYDKSVGK